MVPLLQKQDLSFIRDSELQKELGEQIDALPFDYDESDSYFVVLESLNELSSPFITHEGSDYQIDSLREHCELCEQHNFYFEVLLLIYADLGVSLIIPTSIAKREALEDLLKQKGLL